MKKNSIYFINYFYDNNNDKVTIINHGELKRFSTPKNKTIDLPSGDCFISEYFPYKQYYNATLEILKDS